MTESATYSVLLSGNLKSGFEAEQVVDAFARLFKLTPEKAGAIVGKRFVVKREVELSVAKTYQEKLAAIGVDVKLKRHGGIGELELEPVQLPTSKDGEGDQAEPLGPDEMICPKCALRQTRTEECSGCGVFVDKVPLQVAESEDAETPTPSTAAGKQARVGAAPGEQPFTMKWLIAPLVVTVLGALLWYMIAIKLEYEFGAIAWLIGGAVGFAAVSSGARGDATGVICGLLVLVSICGGKYLTVASQQTQLAEMLSTSLEFEGIDMREFYQQEVNDAREFVKLDDDDTSMRGFMVDHQYSEFTIASQVPDEELEVFREYTAPRLRDIISNRPSFDEWRQYSLGNTIEELSTFDLMVDSLGWMDILFLFFGIGTAYRLASRGV